jgi:hypothetical protein
MEATLVIVAVSGLLGVLLIQTEEQSSAVM